MLVGGTAPGAATVRIIGGAEEVDSPVTNGAFFTSVALQPNRINRLYVIGLSAAGIASAPTALTVIQDGQPPNLFIDFPADGAEITTATTDVAGRVGDLLSGFMGLTVTVNGIPAIVDVGIGNNGTFLASSVPLSDSASTVITATATDELGNAIRKEIAVAHAAVPADAPRMTVVSGNGQAG